MAEKYRPSNGTEGEWFMETYCANCVHDKPESPCKILFATLWLHIDHPEYPAEWCYDADGDPQCTAFSHEDPPPPRCDKTMELDL